MTPETLVAPEMEEAIEELKEAEHLLPRNGNGGSQSTLLVSSDSELEKLNENELKSAILSAWKKHQRLAKKDMGPLLFWLRLRLRAQGSRNDIHEKDRGFGAWVESNLDVARSTAARWADDYGHANGLMTMNLTSTQMGRSCGTSEMIKKQLAKRGKGFTYWVSQPLHKQYEQAVATMKKHFNTDNNGEAVVKGLRYAAKIIAVRSRSGNHRRATATGK
jgi:hypothetical protein